MENRFDISDIRRPDRAAALFMALSIFCLPSCSDRIGPPDTQGQELMRISLATSGVEESASPGITMEGEDAINDVTLFRFSDGVLQETISPSSSGVSGTYTFRVKENAGELRILANSSAVDKLGHLVPGETSLDEFLGLDATPAQMNSDGLLMRGSVTLSGSSAYGLKADLVRSLARLDIRTELAGVEVLETKVSGFAVLFPKLGAIECAGGNFFFIAAELHIGKICGGLIGFGLQLCLLAFQAVAQLAE